MALPDMALEIDLGNPLGRPPAHKVAAGVLARHGCHPAGAETLTHNDLTSGVSCSRLSRHACIAQEINRTLSSLARSQITRSMHPSITNHTHQNHTREAHAPESHTHETHNLNHTIACMAPPPAKHARTHIRTCARTHTHTHAHTHTRRRTRP